MSGNPHSPTSPSAPTDTLNRIVTAKEEAKRKWEGAQEEFRVRQREHEIKMIEMEQVIHAKSTKFPTLS